MSSSHTRSLRGGSALSLKHTRNVPSASAAEIEARYMKSEEERETVFTHSMYAQQQEFSAEKKAQAQGELTRKADFERVMCAMDAEFERSEALRETSYAKTDTQHEDIFCKNEAIREANFTNGQSARMLVFQEAQEMRAKRSDWLATVWETHFSEGRHVAEKICMEFQSTLVDQHRELLNLQESSFSEQERRREELVQIMTTPKVHRTSELDLEDVPGDLDLSAVKDLEVDPISNHPITPSHAPLEHVESPHSVASGASVPIDSWFTTSEVPLTEPSNPGRPEKTTLTSVTLNKFFEGLLHGRVKSHTSLGNDTSLTIPENDRMTLNDSTLSLREKQTIVNCDKQEGADIHNTTAPHAPHPATSINDSDSHALPYTPPHRTFQDIANEVNPACAPNLAKDESKPNDVPLGKPTNFASIMEVSIPRSSSFLARVRRTASRLSPYSLKTSGDSNRMHGGSDISSSDTLEALFEANEERRQHAFLMEEQTRESTFKAAETSRGAAEIERDSAYAEHERARDAKAYFREAAHEQQFCSWESLRGQRTISRHQAFVAVQNQRSLMFSQMLSSVEKRFCDINILEEQNFRFMKKSIERLVDAHRDSLRKARDSLYVQFVKAQNRREKELVIVESPSPSLPRTGRDPPAVTIPPYSNSRNDPRAQFCRRSGSPQQETEVRPPTPVVGFVPNILARSAVNPGAALPLPSSYKPDIAVQPQGFLHHDSRRKHWHVFERSQTSRERSFQNGVKERQHVFHLAERRRQLDFDQKQVERKHVFEVAQRAYEVSFREAQKKRHKVFLQAEMERQAIFHDIESSRNTAFKNSQKTMEKTFNDLQEQLLKRCFEVEGRRISDLEIWVARLLRKRKEEEDILFEQLITSCENGFQRWLSPIL